MWLLYSLSQIVMFMGPTWGPPGSCQSQMGPMLAPLSLLSGMSWLMMTWKPKESGHEQPWLRQLVEPRLSRPWTFKAARYFVDMNTSLIPVQWHVSKTLRCFWALCYVIKVQFVLLKDMYPFLKLWIKMYRLWKNVYIYLYQTVGLYL